MWPTVIYSITNCNLTWLSSCSFLYVSPILVSAGDKYTKATRTFFTNISWLILHEVKILHKLRFYINYNNWLANRMIFFIVLLYSCKYTPCTYSMILTVIAPVTLLLYMIHNTLPTYSFLVRFRKFYFLSFLLWY